MNWSIHVLLAPCTAAYATTGQAVAKRASGRIRRTSAELRGVSTACI